MLQDCFLLILSSIHKLQLHDILELGINLQDDINLRLTEGVNRKQNPRIHPILYRSLLPSLTAFHHSYSHRKRIANFVLCYNGGYNIVITKTPPRELIHILMHCFFVQPFS